MKEKQARESSFAAGEIDVEQLRTEDLEINPHLLDGFVPCSGCDTVFVLPEQRHCSSCTRMFAQHEGQRQSLQRAEQINTGIVPHVATEPDYDPGSPASCIAVGLVFFGALCSAMFLLTGLWYTGRTLIGICLEHSK